MCVVEVSSQSDIVSKKNMNFQSYGPLRDLIILIIYINVDIFTVKGLEVMEELCRNQTLPGSPEPGFCISDLLPPWYNRFRAPLEEGKACRVQMKLTIMSLKSMNPATMTFETDVFLSHYWKDYRFNDVPSDVIDRTLDPRWRKMFWQPDTYFANAQGGNIHGVLIANLYFKLLQDKVIFMSSRIGLKLSCEMILDDYPHDTQECSIVIKTLWNTENEVLLEWRNPVSMSTQIVLPQHDIVRIENKVSRSVYSFGNFTNLLAVIHMKRRQGYYIIHTYIPSIMVVFMSQMSFWLSPDAAPARVALSVTSLLTIVTQQTKATLPEVSTVMAVDIWMLSCSGFVFATLMEFAFITYFFKRRKRLQHNSVSLQETSTKDMAAVFAPRPKSHQKQIVLPATPLPPSERITPERIDRICGVLFPLLFLLQMIIYSLYYLR